MESAVESWVMAIALVLVLEGLMPCISPKRYRQMLKAMTRMPENGVRLAGASLMLMGAILLAMIHP